MTQSLSHPGDQEILTSTATAQKTKPFQMLVILFTNINYRSLLRCALCPGFSRCIRCPMEKILVVDDAPEITQTIVEIFSSSSIQADAAGSVEEAMALVQANQYDLLVLDILLPDGNGFELCTKIRSLRHYKETPILFLSAKEDITAKISAFSIGADDYIVKPFNVLELRARVESRLRKVRERRLNRDRYSVDPFEFEIPAQRLRIKDTNQTVDLTPREFKIAYLLARKPDVIFNRERILDNLGFGDVHVTDRTVDTHICTLRKKLGGLARHIECVPGRRISLQPSPSTVRDCTRLTARLSCS